MKSLKSKVILSAVVLIFALVATIGSTFAWFTVSATVTASSLTLNVSTEKSLLIKVADVDDTYVLGQDYDPSNYTTSLTAASFTTDLGYYLSSWVLRPSTVINPDYDLAYVNTFANINKDTALLTDVTASGVNPMSDATTPSNGGYVIQLKLWVMAQSDANLYVNNVAVLGGTGLGGDTTTETVKDAIEGSTRLAFVSSYTETNVPGKGYIYANPFTEPDPATIDYGYQFPEAPAYTLSTASLVFEGDINELADLTNLNGVTSTTGSLIETLEANVPELISVYVYVEGWDLQANNYIIGAPFRISFGLIID